MKTLVPGDLVGCRLAATLGLYGFGSSASLTAQIAQAAGARIFAITRGGRETNGSLAPRVPCSSARRMPCLTNRSTPQSSSRQQERSCPQALAATKRGGTVVIAGIHMTDIPALNYEADLFNERDLRTVTANTRADGAAFLRIAANRALTPRRNRPTRSARSIQRSTICVRGRASGSLVISMT